MELRDGTYIKLGRRVERIELNHGYWVGVREVELDSINSGTLFGAWEDDAGKVWLDLVEYKDTLEEAIQLGNRHNQLAIYDNYNQEAITL